MDNIQVGHAVNSSISLQELANSFVDIIDFSQIDSSWILADFHILETLMKSTIVDSTKQLSKEILIKRLEKKTMIKESYIRLSLNKLFKIHVQENGMINGICFKRQ